LTESELRVSPLDGLHRALGARMVSFAGWSLPVQYRDGIIAEHLHCRQAAALFDVSHMGQFSLHGPPTDVARALEALVPGDLLGLAEGRQRYTLLLNEAAGVLDDVMAQRLKQGWRLVVNAARADADARHLAEFLPGLELEIHERALLALQGPLAAMVLARHAPDLPALPFMAVAEIVIRGIPAWVTRGGYTGEDGFEISLPAAQATAFAEALLAEPEVKPAGLGARDSLRLEAGLPLYGHDLDELTSPVEAGLAWTIGKRRRQDWCFPGAIAIRDQLTHGPVRHRVGIRLEGRQPVRAMAPILAQDGTEAGDVTSGLFSPSLQAPIAMGFVRRGLEAPGTALLLAVRGQNLPGRVTPLPFIPHRYHR
jgi:aminomethyltransferase